VMNLSLQGRKSILQNWKTSHLDAFRIFRKPQTVVFGRIRPIRIKDGVIDLILTCRFDMVHFPNQTYKADTCNQLWLRWGALNCKNIR